MPDTDYTGYLNTKPYGSGDPLAFGVAGTLQHLAPEAFGLSATPPYYGVEEEHAEEATAEDATETDLTVKAAGGDDDAQGDDAASGTDDDGDAEGDDTPEA